MDNMQIYISEWLRNYPEVYESLCAAFEKSGVKWQFLDHTKEVWARDYMPLHLGDCTYVSFTFFPAYLSKHPGPSINCQENVI